MITVKFPALNKALTKNVKDLPEDDPRRGVIVLNNNAIVLRNSFCIVCDLYEYFTLEAGLEDDHEVEELDRILFFMDGKIFSNEFWAELTKGSNVKINEGNIFIENPKYAKDLHYKEIPFNLLEPLQKIEKIALQGENMLSAVALPFASLNIIYSCLAPEFKQDVIIFEFDTQETPVKFTFRKRKHFYGYIMPHYDSIQEGFRFDILDEFYSSVKEDIYRLNQEKEKKIIPPPPTD
jgi:hypothetical protein